MQGNGCRVPAGAIGVLRPDAGERYYFGNMGKRNAGQLVLSGCWWFCAGGCGCSRPAGNGCSRPAGAIDALRLCAGGYGCSRPAGNGCSRPAGSIRVLRLCAGGYGCSRPAGAIGVLRPDAGCQLVLLGC